ncbi:MAG: bacillithiol transferase BstA [Bryobacteraceae bacterium]
MDDLRYPVGRFECPSTHDKVDRNGWLEEMAELPAQVRLAVGALPEGGLDRPYRDGGWTARQVVHHLADSHMNSYIRFRLALTEDCPTIKPYDEAAWAELADARSAPVDLSLSLLGSLHARWVTLLRSLATNDWTRRLTHPESGELDLHTMLGLYAWHGRHHLAHIRAIR